MARGGGGGGSGSRGALRKRRWVVRGRREKGEGQEEAEETPSGLQEGPGRRRRAIGPLFEPSWGRPGVSERPQAGPQKAPERAPRRA